MEGAGKSKNLESDAVKTILIEEAILNFTIEKF